MNNNNNNGHDSNGGLSPCSWGSAAWHFLHSISLAYPVKVGFTPQDQKIKNDYYQFFNLLGDVLPCDQCKIHYRQNFESNNLMNSLSSRRDFAKWVYDLHNMVNKQTGVPESKWPTFRDVYLKYDNLRANCNSLPGVCGGGDNEMQCSVELRPKGIEGFSLSNSTEREKVLIAIICVLGVLLIIGFLYNMSCGKSVKKRKTVKRNYGRSYRRGYGRY